MTISYSYKIKGVSVVNVGGMPDVIRKVEVVVKGSDGGVEFELPSEVELSDPDPNGFVDFNNISEAHVTGWLDTCQKIIPIKEHIQTVVERGLADAALQKKDLPWMAEEPTQGS